jgi:hypothetical protein
MIVRRCQRLAIVIAAAYLFFNVEWLYVFASLKRKKNWKMY